MIRHLALITLAATALNAQTFESATITHYFPQDDDTSAAREPGHMVYSNISLKLLLAAAYNVRADQVNGPGWIDSERYDISVKPPAGATKDEVPAMLQHLLADRFHVVTRIEMRDRVSYALTVGKQGLQLPRAKAITGVNISVSPDHVDVTGASVPAFAGLLAGWIGRPVTDQTSIQGSYDFRLNVTMAELKSGAPAVFTAIQGLGLTLEARTTPTQYVVVETAAPPALN